MPDWEIRNALGLALMPPGCLLLVTLVGLVLLKRRRRWGKSLIAAAWLALYALSTPYIATTLLQSLQAPYTDPAANRRGQAIVVLGGGKYYEAPEYDAADTVNAQALGRLRYGARLYRELGKPVLVTGGAPRGEARSEAETMRQVLEDEFNVPVRWVEKTSTTTEENAALSYRLLHEVGVDTVYLVTHAWHMKRAQASFERAGFTVIPAPTLYKTHGPRKIVDFMPDAHALEDSSSYVHEALGLAWYRLKSFVTSRPS